MFKVVHEKFVSVFVVLLFRLLRLSHSVLCIQFIFIVVAFLLFLISPLLVSFLFAGDVVYAKSIATNAGISAFYNKVNYYLLLFVVVCRLLRITCSIVTQTHTFLNLLYLRYFLFIIVWNVKAHCSFHFLSLSYFISLAV